MKRAPRILLALYLLCTSTACDALRPREVLILWHSLDGPRERTLLRLVDQWNQTNPDDIFIVPEQRSSSAQHDAVLSGINTKALPALILAEPAQAAVYERNGILAPLEAYINSADLSMGWDAADQADLYPFVLEAGKTPQGKLIGMPFGGDIRVMFFNRDWLQTLQANTPNTPNASSAPPADWAGFAELCAAATDRSQGTICFAVNPAELLFEEWVAAHGGQIVAPENGQLQIASPASIQAVNELLQYPNSGQAYRAVSRLRSRDDFAAARVLFAFDWGSRLREYGNVIRELSNFGWDVSTMPAPAPTSTSTSASSPSPIQQPIGLSHAPLWVIPKSTPGRMQAAWKFVRWLLDAPQTSQWAQETGELPARASAINQIDQPNTSSAFASVLQRIAPHARPEPLYSGWPCVHEELATAMRQVFDNQPVTDTLQLAQTKAEQVLNTDCSTR